METIAAQPDPEKMTNTEMNAHFSKLVAKQAQDVDTRFVETVDKIEGLENTFNTKLDAKFQEVLDRLPAPAPAPPAAPAPHPQHQVGRARRVPLQHGAAAAAAHVELDDQEDEYEGEDEYEDKNEVAGEVHFQPPSRPRAYIRNARPPPRPQVRDDDHVAKLKFNIQPFEDRYNPDAYLTWELKVEQCFACLNYPEDKRVSAATCEFTDFASIWWSKHCRLYHANIPSTWTALKAAMRTRFVPPNYQRDLLKKLTRLEQGKIL
jgi:hypothetical protein